MLIQERLPLQHPCEFASHMARPVAGLGLLLLSFIAFVVLTFWLLLSNFVVSFGMR